MKCSLLCGFLLLGLSSPPVLLGQEWLGVTGGNWNDESAWTPNGVPDAFGAAVAIRSEPTASATIALNGNSYTVGSLAIHGARNKVWTLSGGTLTLAGSSRPVISTSGGVGSGDQIAILNVALAGTQGFIYQGDHRLTLGVTSALTGGVEIQGGVLLLNHSLVLGTNQLTLKGGNLLLSGTVAARHYANAIVLDQATSNLDVGNGYANAVTLSGGIGEEGEGRAVVFRSNTTNGKFILTHEGSYTGSTTIGTNIDMNVELQHAAALGDNTAEVVMGQAGTLELSGGLTYAPKSLVLSGAGALGTSGSLRSLSGENVWTGSVDTGTAANATIRVDEGSLHITGLVTGTASGGLVKTGAGELLLSHAGNDFSNGLRIVEGKVIVEASGAEGVSGRLRLEGGTLALAGVAAMFNGLELSADSVLDFGTGEGASLGFDASHELSWNGSLTILNWTPGVDLLRFGIDATGLTPEQLGNILFDGWEPGAWIDADGYISAIPEPGFAAFLAAGAGLVLGTRRSRRKNS